ncbi:hypothetical protein ABPG72_013832 [Tetrahymena utriculariae]
MYGCNSFWFDLYSSGFILQVWFIWSTWPSINGMLLSYLNNFTKLNQKQFAQKTGLVDKRVNLTNEVIEGIRLIKMYAWESAFLKAAKEIRKLELKKVFIIIFIFITEHSMSLSQVFWVHSLYSY